MYSACGALTRIHSIYISKPAPVHCIISVFAVSNSLSSCHSLQVVIPMKFKGSGYVEMRAPENLDDLKAYTSLSLSLQRPEGGGDGRRRRRRQTRGDMFVLYLGSRDVSESKGI